MEISQEQLDHIIRVASAQAVSELEERGFLKAKHHITVLEKTKRLLAEYNDFKKVVEATLQDIEAIRKDGRSIGSNPAVRQYDGNANPANVHGLRTMWESVEDTVLGKMESISKTKETIERIEWGLDQLKNDPYYEILVMYFIEGATQEEVALYFGKTQATISTQMNRLLKTMAQYLFPEESLDEIIR